LKGAKYMKYSGEVCLLALTLATTAALTTGAQSASPVQTMQVGISVELPITSNAVAMPTADREDSLVVSVTQGGNVYLGITAIGAADLPENLKRALSSENGNKLYIKADARAPYASLEKVLDAARAAGVETPALLTAQQVTSAQSIPLPPRGLDVRVGSAVPSDSRSITVHVLNSGQRRPALKINNENISWDTIRKTPSQFFPIGKVISITADALLPVARVVEVIDACESTGAKVLLVTPRT
jgi:biopolymer transport protein ExbD